MAQNLQPEPQHSTDLAVMPEVAESGPSVPELARGVDFTYRLIDDGKLSEHFRGVLDEFDVRMPNGKQLWEESIETIIKRTQDIFLRGADDDSAIKLNGRFGDITEKFVYELNEQLMGDGLYRDYTNSGTELSLFSELDLIDAINPILDRVDSIVLLPLTAPSIIHRTDFLSTLWNEKRIQAREILLVGGERQILYSDSGWIIDHYGINPPQDEIGNASFMLAINKRAAKDEALSFITLDSTKSEGEQIRFSESSFAKWYIDTQGEDCPASWKGPSGIAQPGNTKTSEEGGKITTGSTLANLEPSQSPKDIIVVSSQPYVTRQGTDSLYTLLSNDWKVKSFSAIGPAKSIPTDPRAIFIEIVKQLRGEARLLGYVC